MVDGQQAAIRSIFVTLRKVYDIQTGRQIDNEVRQIVCYTGRSATLKRENHGQHRRLILHEYLAEADNVIVDIVGSIRQRLGVNGLQVERVRAGNIDKFEMSLCLCNLGHSRLDILNLQRLRLKCSGL